MQTIDVTPKWLDLIPVLCTILTEGTEEGKRLATEELRRMAIAADSFNNLVREKHGK